MKKKKNLKIFAAGGLALFMGIGTLCGVLISPITSAQASVSSSEETLNQNPNISPLGLDPENDPVVFTTDYGLEIKYANALTNLALANYTYFTLGDYNGTFVNWIIIGYNSSLSHLVGKSSGEIGFWSKRKVESNYTWTDTIDESVAGKAIIYDNFCISSQAVQNDKDIAENCVLCLSESVINLLVDAVNNYDASYHKNAMTTLWDSALNIPNFYKNLIQPQKLLNYYYNTTSTTTNAYLFPLGYRTGENFILSTYLSSSLTIAYNIGTTTPATYWTRSGYSVNGGARAYYVTTAGGIDHDSSTNRGVRPAFVLKLI